MLKQLPGFRHERRIITTDSLYGEGQSAGLASSFQRSQDRGLLLRQIRRSRWRVRPCRWRLSRSLRPDLVQPIMDP